MKKLIATLLIFQLLMPTAALASAGTVIDGGYIRGMWKGNRDFVANPIGEKNATSWTLTNGSGTATFARDASAGNTLEGISSLKFLAAGSGDYVTSSAWTVDAGTSGDCQVDIVYKTSTSVYTVSLMSGTTALSTVALGASSSFATQSINYPCGNYSLKIGATGTASTNALNYGIHFTKATNIVSLSQAEFVGSIKWSPTTNCLWTQDAGWGPSADADCDDNARTVSGSITDSSAGQKPQFGLTTKPGRYVVKIRGVVLAQGTSGVYVVNTRLNSSVVGQLGFTKYHGVNSGSGAAGDTSYEEEFEWSEDSSRTLTVDYQCMENTTSATCYFDARYTPFEISVYRFPTQLEQAVKIDQAAINWSGYMSNAVSGGTTSATPADVTSTGITITTRINNNMGTVAKSSDSVYGITFTPPRTGTYRVCANGTYEVGGGTYTGTVQMTDGSNNVLNPGQAQSMQSGYWTPFSLCGDYVAASLTAAVIKLRLAVAAGATTIRFDSDAVRGASTVWTITEINSSMAAPILTGGDLVTDSYSTTGTSNSDSTWVAPSTVSSVLVCGRAGGGSGGSGGCGATAMGGWGGGGSITTCKSVTVTPGTTYYVRVGGGGAGVAGSTTTPYGVAGNDGAPTCLSTASACGGSVLAQWIGAKGGTVSAWSTGLQYWEMGSGTGGHGGVGGDASQAYGSGGGYGVAAGGSRGGSAFMSGGGGGGGDGAGGNGGLGVNSGGAGSGVAGVAGGGGGGGGGTAQACPTSGGSSGAGGPGALTITYKK